tara:strand:- start:746 stop:1321 length:576 start_codon:yes stop_codon:yes gene_type:complete
VKFINEYLDITGRKLINSKSNLPLLFALFLGCNALANPTGTGTSWVDESIPILSIGNKHRQAEAWGMCSAVNKIASETFGGDMPAMAKNYNDRANGAAIAAGMTYYVKGQNKNLYTPDQMQASWILSQNMAKSIPEVQLNAIMAQLETSDNQTWMYNLTATLRTCDSNLDGQQFYIDFWRELAGSGLLKLK